MWEQIRWKLFGEWKLFGWIIGITVVIAIVFWVGMSVVLIHFIQKFW